MLRIRKIVCLGLFLIASSLIIRRIAYINDERAHAEEQLGAVKWAMGFRDAGNDFFAGRRRIYSMKIVPYPPIGQPFYGLTNELIGRTNGFEIWSWPAYQSDGVDRRMLQAQLDGYNLHMTFFHRFYRKPHRQATANANIGLTTALRHIPLTAESK